jgi:hypothetical protein
VVVRQLHGGQGAQVVRDDVGAFDVEDVQKGEQVVQPGLAFHVRVRGHGPAGSTQVGTDDAVAAGGDDRGHDAPLPPVLGETVQEDDRLALADRGHVSL